MIELIDKDIKIIITTFHMFKKVEGSMHEHVKQKHGRYGN